jgi:hypothetical protein
MVSIIPAPKLSLYPVFNDSIFNFGDITKISLTTPLLTECRKVTSHSVAPTMRSKITRLPEERIKLEGSRGVKVRMRRIKRIQAGKMAPARLFLKNEFLMVGVKG